MKFQLLCPAALLLLAFVAERAAADPEAVTPKSDSIDDSLPLAKERSLNGASAPGKLLGGGGKGDSTDKHISVGKERSESGASAPGNLLGGGRKGDSIDYIPASAPESGKDDTVVVVVSKEHPGDIDETSNEEVKKLRKQLANERKKVNSLNEQSANLMAGLQKSNVEVFKLGQEKTNLTTELKAVKRKLVLQEIRLSSERTSLDKCQKLSGDLNGSQIAKLVEEETRRQVEDRRAAIDFAQKLKYLALLSDLRQRIKRDMDESSDKVKWTPKLQTKIPTKRIPKRKKPTSDSE